MAVRNLVLKLSAAVLVSGVGTPAVAESVPVIYGTEHFSRQVDWATGPSWMSEVEIGHPWIEFTTRQHIDGIELTWSQPRDQSYVTVQVFDPAEGLYGRSARSVSCSSTWNSPCFIDAKPGWRIALMEFRASNIEPQYIERCNYDEMAMVNNCHVESIRWPVGFGSYGGICPGCSWSTPVTIFSTVALSPIQSPTLLAQDGGATVSWTNAAMPNDSEVIGAVVTASPGGATCQARGTTSCQLSGLRNQQPYSITIQALLSDGYAAPTVVSDPVTPLTSGLQAWPRTRVVRIGGAAALAVGNAPAGATVNIRGSGTLNVPAGRDGIAEASLVMSKPGVWVYWASYTTTAGRRRTVTKCATRVYVPMFVSPMTRIKPGKSGTFKLSYAPANVPVQVSLSDGRQVTAITDSAGKAVLSALFSDRGAVTYTVIVEGQVIGTGGLTVY